MQFSLWKLRNHTSQNQDHLTSWKREKERDIKDLIIKLTDTFKIEACIKFGGFSDQWEIFPRFAAPNINFKNYGHDSRLSHTHLNTISRAYNSKSSSLFLFFSSGKSLADILLVLIPFARSRYSVNNESSNPCKPLQRAGLCGGHRWTNERRSDRDEREAKGCKNTSGW